MGALVLVNGGPRVPMRPENRLWHPPSAEEEPRLAILVVVTASATDGHNHGVGKLLPTLGGGEVLIENSLLPGGHVAALYVIVKFPRSMNSTAAAVMSCDPVSPRMTYETV